MDKKLFISLLIIVIIIVASFLGMHVLPIENIHQIPESMLNQVLYVCPFKNTTFNTLAKTLASFKEQLNFVFFVSLVILIIAWSWAMYQTLLKDSFKKDIFKNPWFFTKVFFWIVLVITILSKTPNFYRNVIIEGSSQKWVLCEKNSENSKAVLSKSVKVR